MKRQRLFIFDWNGTLQDDVPLYYEYSVCRIFRNHGLTPPSLDEYRAQVTADLMSFYHERGIPRTLDIDELFRQSRLAIVADGKRAELFPDVRPVLERLREAGHKMGLVSMAPLFDLKETLDEHGITQFFRLISGGTRDKLTTFERHWAESRLSREDCFVVGDLADDAIAAAAAGLTPIICVRGYHSRERVEAARRQAPNLVIIENLNEILSRFL